MIYRELGEAPENERVSVVWGETSQNPEYGLAVRLGTRWYIYGQANPYANGKPCAKPDGWLPGKREQWTEAERTLSDILAMYPGIAEEISTRRRERASVATTQ
jgi:hypothetical protein